MARQTFPDDRFVLRPGSAGSVVRNAAGASAVVYADAAGSTLADIQTPDGTPIAGSTLTVDGSSRLPLFLGPDGVDTLWVTIDGGPVTAIYARVDDRIDVLESAWISVLAYGAAGDNATDDTAAIQAAINACPAGGVVYLPVGKYRTTAPLVLSSGVTLRGTHAGHLDILNDTAGVAKIRPRSTFAGAAVIYIPDGGSTAGNPLPTYEQRLIDLTIDGSALPAGTSVDAIQTHGIVHGLYIDSVGVFGHRYGLNLETNGVTGEINRAYSIRVNRLHVIDSQKSAVVAINCTDSTWIDVEAEACGDATNPGFVVTGGGQSQWIACRAEECYVGFQLTDVGDTTWLGCSTHRCHRDGVVLSSTSGAITNGVPVAFVGHRSIGDGRNADAGGGGYAGFTINGCAEPVKISALTVRPETTTPSPQYGLQVTGSRSVSVSNSYLWAISTGWRDGGSNVTVKLGQTTERTGTYASPTSVLSADTTTNHLHTSGNAYGIVTPTQHGLIAWTADPATPAGGKQAVGGTVYLAAVWVQRPVTATKLLWGINTVGVTPTAGQNFVGLYDSAGNRLASVGVDARVTTTGMFTETISVALTPGRYWVAFVFNATTPPQPYRSNDLNATLANAGIATASQYRYATNGTAQTALPASITPASNAISQFTYWAALG